MDCKPLPSIRQNELFCLIKFFPFFEPPLRVQHNCSEKEQLCCLKSGIIGGYEVKMILSMQGQVILNRFTKFSNWEASSDRP